MARLAHFLMASEWRAALIASALLFLPLVSWIGASVVALFVLRRGPVKSSFVISVPIVIAMVMAFSFANSDMLVVLMITTILAAVLQRKMGWLAVMQVVLAVSIGLTFLIGVLYEETLKGLVAAVKEVIAAPEQLAALGVDLSTVDAWMGSLSVGALSFVLMVSALCALVFARVMQAQAFNSGGFKAEFEIFKLPGLMASGCLILMVAGFLVDPWMLRFSPVAALPLVFAGMALVHGLTSMTGSKRLLTMFYVALLFFTPYLLLLLAFLAVIDAFSDFRTRAQNEPL